MGVQQIVKSISSRHHLAGMVLCELDFLCKRKFASHFCSALKIY